MHADPIGDMLNRLKTASMAGKELVSVPYSKANANVLEVLRKTKYIAGYKIKKGEKFNSLDVSLLSDRGVLNLKRVSKPGCRIFTKGKDLKPLMRGYGIYIISTSQGVMPGFEAYEKGIGGELIGMVY